jgi:ketosteroid isomerase-like protein
MVCEEIASVRHATQRLFSALTRRDPAGIVACYDRSGSFSSPIAGDIRRQDLEAFWRSVFKRTRDNELTFAIMDAGLTHARVEGCASYVLLASGRNVSCPFVSMLHVRDGLVRRHVDFFDAWAWAQMAFGASGLVLGWSNTWRRRRCSPLPHYHALRQKQGVNCVGNGYVSSRVKGTLGVSGCRDSPSPNASLQ